MKLRIPLALFLVYSACFTTHAQLRFASLGEVLAYADKNAIGIQNTKSQEQIAAAQNRASKTALLPSLNGAAGFNDNITLQPTLVPANLFNPAAPAESFNEYTFGRKYIYNVGVQAGWEIVNVQKWFDVKTTDAIQELNKANTLNTRYQVFNQLAQTYYSILLTERYLGISKRNTAASDSIYLIAKEKYQAGIFTEENRNRGRIRQIQSQQQVNSLSASLQQLYHQLQSQLNTADKIVLEEKLSATGTLNEIDKMPVHPEVRIQEAQFQLNLQQLKQARASQYPTLSLNYQLNRNWATDRMFDLSAANNLPQQFWSIRLNIPIFNGFSAKEKINQFQLKAEQQKKALDNSKLVSQKGDNILKIQYRQSVEDLLKQEEVLALQCVNDEHAKNRYESGIMGLDERLDKFQELLNVQNQYIQTLGNYYITYYKLFIRTIIAKNNSL